MDDNNPIAPGTALAPVKLSSVFLKLGSNAGAVRSFSQFQLASNMWNPLLPGVGSNVKMSMFVGARLPDVSGVMTAPKTCTGVNYAFTSLGTFTAGVALPVTVTYGSNTQTNAWTVTEQATLVDGTGGAFGAITCNIAMFGLNFGVIPQTRLASKVGSNAVYVQTTLTPTIMVLKRNGKTKSRACTPVVVANNAVPAGTVTFTVGSTAAYNNTPIANTVNSYNAAYSYTNYNTVNGVNHNVDGDYPIYGPDIAVWNGYYAGFPAYIQPITYWYWDRHGYGWQFSEGFYTNAGYVNNSYAYYGSTSASSYYTHADGQGNVPVPAAPAVNANIAYYYHKQVGTGHNYNTEPWTNHPPDPAVQVPATAKAYNHPGNTRTANYAFNQTYNTLPNFTATFNYNAANAATATLTIGATTRTAAVNKAATAYVTTYT